FSQLGFHPGFGLTLTLPLIVGHQRALDLLYTGRRIDAAEAAAIGLADQVAPHDQVRQVAHALAASIASAAPLSLRSIKAAMRADLYEQYVAATERELAEQSRLRQTSDFGEGVAAYAERRPPNFTGA